MMIRSLLLFGLLLIPSLGFCGQPAGKWRGGWQSHTSGHHGPMHATVTPRSDGQYNARFTGRFALVIPFTYRVTMTPVEYGPEGTTLVASRRLPLLGIYNMTATVHGNRLDAAYTSKSDQGAFHMQRR